MPGTSRIFPSLLRAFGVSGFGGDVSVPLTRAVFPVVRVDDYDPPPCYGYRIIAPIGDGVTQIPLIEINCSQILRIVSLISEGQAVTLSTKGQFGTGGVLLPTRPRFTSDGTRPADIAIRSDLVVVVATDAFRLGNNVAGWPPTVPPTFGQGLCLRLEGENVLVPLIIDIMLQATRATATAGDL